MTSLPRVNVVSASSIDRFEVDDVVFVFLGEETPPPLPGTSLSVYLKLPKLL